MNKVFFLVISLLFIHCKHIPVKSYNYNFEKMKYFDVKKFEQNKGKQDEDAEEAYLYRLADGYQVKEYSDIENNEVVYIRELRRPFEPLNYYYLYYNNGNLSVEIKNFNSSPLIYREWDRIGKLVEETNYNKSFKHSFQQIREIVLRERKADIYDTKQAIVNRVDARGDDILPRIKVYYQVRLFDSYTVEGELIFKIKESFLIDDETGEILTKEMIDRINSKEQKTTTFNGKTYTEEEWKAFEQEQWEKYQAKRSKKGFFDWLFG